ncbi:MAG: ABC transporter ATP-binding protein [Armatimonadetes bacterium]|nr:ABC transporter ATP-binding protein [Armatimonadota bacterium]
MLIEMRDIHKVYQMGKQRVHALAGVDLQIEPGEMVAVMGPSGSGKSTIMNILGCLDRPTRGTYLLEGQSVADLDNDALAAIRSRKIGFVFQTYNLLPRTPALANVLLPLMYQGARNRRERAERALARVGMADRMDHRPSELSGGQQQRVAVARALVTEPAIVLADEPTGNLDSRTSIEIMQLFRQLNEEGVTIVLVTHDQDIADCARRIVRVRDGRIVSDGPARYALPHEALGGGGSDTSEEAEGGGAQAVSSAGGTTPSGNSTPASSASS